MLVLASMLAKWVMMRQLARQIAVRIVQGGESSLDADS